MEKEYQNKERKERRIVYEKENTKTTAQVSIIAAGSSNIHNGAGNAGIG